MNMQNYIIYTDGSYSSSTENGGWGALLTINNQYSIFQGCEKKENNPTSNRMEMLSAIKGIEGTPADSIIKIFSDSQYLIGTMTKKWNRGKNLDLWKELDRLCLNRNITWEKIEGHSGIPENEFVNALAQFQSGVLSKEPKIENYKIAFEKSSEQAVSPSELFQNPEKLTHVDKSGNAQMVNIGNKNETKRIAKAQGAVKIRTDVLSMIQKNSIPKGDVLSAARLAGIMAAKQTDKLIPLCHQIPLESVTVDFSFSENPSEIIIHSTVEAFWKTGVEMEALTAVAVAGLTIYDMCKASDKRIIIDNIHLIKKSGGKSGEFQFDS